MAKRFLDRLRKAKTVEEEEKKQSFFDKYGYLIAVGFVLILVILNAVFTFYYRHVIIKYQVTSEQISNVRSDMNKVLDVFRLADLGIRGYMIHQREDIFRPYETGVTFYGEVSVSLPDHLEQVGYDSKKVTPLINNTREYLDLLLQMKYLVDNGQKNDAIEIFRQDKGYDLWLIYEAASIDVNSFVSELELSSQKSYANFKSSTLVLQILLLAFIVPILILLFRRMSIDSKKRRSLLTNLDNSNRSYIFDSNESYQVHHESAVVKRLIANLEKASYFINNIAKENYDVRWDGLDDSNRHLNSESIAGELVVMRDKMKMVKEEDEKRLWITSGLNKFSEILRNHTDNLESLADTILSELVKYVKGSQGGIFLLEKDDKGEECLELKSCFAYERKKYLQKQIKKTEGLLGQCYLEQNVIYMEKVPENYVSITSALGGTRPKSLLIVPIRTNENIEGVLELAFMRDLQEHEIEFVKQLGELLAAEVINVRVADKTKTLLEQSQQQSEELKAQEEEMRQNMEEIQATQEQMHRKTQEYEQEIERLSKLVEDLKSESVD